MAETQQQTKHFQRRWLIIGAIMILAVIFLIPFIQEGGARVDTSVIVETEQAFVGSIRETAHGLAQVTEAKSQSVRLPYQGKLESLAVAEGDWVNEGDMIALYDVQSLEKQVNSWMDQLEDLEKTIENADDGTSGVLTSGTDGLVKAVYVQRGDRSDVAAEAYGGLLEISADGLLRVEIPLYEEAEEGQTVTVTIGEQQEEGTVALCDRENALLQITFPDSADYALGQTARISLGENQLGQGVICSNSPWLLESERCIVSQLEVTVGDWVEKGDELVYCIMAEQNQAYQALLEERKTLVDELFRLQEFLHAPMLMAERSGVIRELVLEAGDKTEAGSQLCRIASTEAFYARVSLPEEVCSRVATGQAVELTVAGRTVPGKVILTGKAEEETPGLTLCPVQIMVTEAEGLESGDTGSCVVVLEQEESAILVPKEAVLVNEDGSKSVEISYGDGLNRFNAVETGLEDGTYVQILKGVDEGENVVVASHTVAKKVYSFLGFEWTVEE